MFVWAKSQTKVTLNFYFLTMKKTIFLILLVTLGFGAHGIKVHAVTVTPPSAAAVIGAEETRILTESLRVLQTLLNAMEASLANAATPLPNAAEMNATLDRLLVELARLNKAIETQALAYAGQGREAMPSPPLVVKAPPAAEIEEQMEALPSPSLETTLAPPQETEELEEVASVEATVSPSNILWLVLVVVAIGGAIFFFRWRGKEPVAEEGKKRKSSVPMVREKETQGIPPDY